MTNKIIEYCFRVFWFLFILTCKISIWIIIHAAGFTVNFILGFYAGFKAGYIAEKEKAQAAAAAGKDPEPKKAIDPTLLEFDN